MRRRLIRVFGGVTFVVSMAGLGVYLAATGLDRADKLASVVSLFVSLVGLALAINGHGTTRRLHVPDDQEQPTERSRVPGDEETILTAKFPLAGLPARTESFTGRETELESLLRLLDPSAVEPARVTVIAGLAGVGKTELVLQAAHESLARGWFPGGVLMTDLHGYDEARRVAAPHAADDFLRSLGLAPASIPATDEARLRLYREQLGKLADDGKQILLIIDNAVSAGQVEPLLPGVGRTVVTSRHTLNLAARHLTLNVLDDEAGVDMLDLRLRLATGSRDLRAREDPQAAGDLVRLCGGLPLALHILTGLLMAAPAKPLRVLADELAAELGRLDRLRFEERSVRAAFELSYRGLQAEQARLFRLLTVDPSPEFSNETATLISRLPAEAARQAVEELHRAHLIESAASYGRWHMHDLVRLYSEELGRTHAKGDRRAVVRQRLLRHYLVTMETAFSLIDENRATANSRFRDADEARNWLRAEHQNITAAVLTIARDRPGELLRHARLLAPLLHDERRLDSCIALLVPAERAARLLNDTGAQAWSSRLLGTALSESGRVAEGVEFLETAVRLYRQNGEREHEAAGLVALARALHAAGQQDRVAETYRSAVDLAKTLGDRRFLSDVLERFGSWLVVEGRTAEAVVAFRDRLRLVLDLGEDSRVPTRDLIMALSASGDDDDPHQLATVTDELLQLAQHVGDDMSRLETVYFLLRLAESLREHGFIMQAADAYHRASSTYQELDAQRSWVQEDPGDFIRLAAFQLMICATMLAKAREFQQAADDAREAIHLLKGASYQDFQDKLLRRSARIVIIRAWAHLRIKAIRPRNLLR